MKRLKIASFAFRSYPAKGGVEYHQQLITEFFAKKGHKVDIYTSRSVSNDEFTNVDFKPPFIHRKKRESALKKIQAINSVTYRRFDVSFRFYSYNSMKGLYRQFEKDVGSYDLVHLHGLNVYNNYVLSKICRKHDVPVILSCYDISIPDNLPGITKIFKKVYDRMFIRKMDKNIRQFLLLTRDQIRELENIGIQKKKIQVWSAGFDVEKYRRRLSSEQKGILSRYGLSKGSYVFNMGRIEEYKGIQDIIKIAKDFPKMKFIIAGKDQGYLPTLREQARLSRSENVEFIGEIDNIEATALLQNAKAFLFPSRKEGWGIVLAEAMSVGVPCVAYDIQNVRTVFSDKRSGFLVNDIKEMKSALRTLIHDKKAYARLSQNAKKEAEKYDFRLNLPILEEIYKKELRS